MNCPICKTQSTKVGTNTVFSKDIDVLQCKNSKCLLYFLDLPKDTSFINDFYEKQYWDDFSNRKSSKSISKQSLKTKLSIPISKLLGFYFQFSMRYYTYLKKHSLNSGNLLEIGCKDGRVLEFFSKKNFICDGIEPDKQNAAFSRTKTNGKIHNCVFEDFSTKTKYNLIILSHVLEHMIDLNSSLQKIKKLLDKNGQVFLIIPNGENNNILNEIIYEHPHIYTFNINNIKTALENNGFKIVSSGIFNPFLMSKNILFKFLNKKQKDYSEIWVYAQKK